MPLVDGQVQVGGLTMGPGTPFTVEGGFDPWSMQVREQGGGERAWGHGSWSGARWASALEVPVPVLIDAGSESLWREAQAALVAAFAPSGAGGELVELRWGHDGREFVKFGHAGQVATAWAAPGQGQSKHRCVFVALDPLIYDGSVVVPVQFGLPRFEGGLTISGSVGGGLVLDGTSGTYADTPSTSAMESVDGLDVRVVAPVSIWANDPNGGRYVVDRTGQFRLQVPGSLDRPFFEVTTSAGTLSTAPSQSAWDAAVDGLGDTVEVRGWYDPDYDGANGRMAVEVRSASGGEWVPVAGNTSSGHHGLSPVSASGEPLAVGARSSGSLTLEGQVRRVEMRDSPGGAVVASPRFDQQPSGTSSFEDAQGNTWSLNGAAEIDGSDGLTVPFTVDGVAVDGQADLTNEGTAPHGLTLRVDGPVQEPRVSLSRPDGVTQTLRFGLVLAAGQWLEVDTAARTVLLNGLPQASRRGQTSGMWPMLPEGTSTLRFRAGDASDEASVTVFGPLSAWW